MADLSSILAWEILLTEEAGKLQSVHGVTESDMTATKQRRRRRYIY